MAGGNILTPGMSGGRQGVMKEKVVEVKAVRAPMKVAYNSERNFDDKVNELIEKGYQPMPNSFRVNDNAATILMMKTEVKVEMI